MAPGLRQDYNEERAPYTSHAVKSVRIPAAQCCVDCNALLRRRYLQSAL